MKNKTTNQLELNQLLELLEKNPEQQDLDKDDIHRFLSIYDLKPGDNKVSGKLLLALYNSTAQNKLTLSLFFSKIELYLSRHKATKYFLVNKQLDFLASTLHQYIKDKRHKKFSFRRKHFERFLNRFKIEQGEIKTPLNELKSLYTHWIKVDHPNAKTIKMDMFTDYLKLYFKFKIAQDRRVYFYINKDIKVNMEQK